MARTLRSSLTGQRDQLDRHRSELKPARRLLNRRDRHDAKRQLRRNPDGVENRAAKGALRVAI